MHAGRGSVFGLDAGAFDEPSTKQAAELIDERRGGSVLLVLSGPDESSAFKSFRNLAGVTVLAAADCGVADLVGAASVVFSQAALDSVTARARARNQMSRPDAGHGGQNAGPDAPRSNKLREASA